VPRLKKAVTSALVVIGATAISSIQAQASEDEAVSWLDDDISLLEKEIMEKALRNYTNPLRRVQTTIQKNQKEDRIIYEVKMGDTLSGIAQSFGIKQAEIIQENNIRNKHLLSIGQKLTIRLKEKSYIVKHGESITDIAKQQGITSEELVAYNTRLKGTTYALYPGQSISIPTAPPEPAHQPVASPKKNQKPKKTVTIASRSEEGVKISSLAWPITGKLTSSYGTRWGRMHNGIDISHSDESKAPIKAASAGIVTDAYFHRGGYGNLIIINHGDGLETYYAHLSKINVKEGDEVAAGQLIGYMGRTGNATGYHLHFEIRKNNRPMNPIKHLPR
jgi:murein DD-endopeptidase MepM/ murein hydrolase activator NlpD